MDDGVGTMSSKYLSEARHNGILIVVIIIAISISIQTQFEAVGSEIPVGSRGGSYSDDFGTADDVTLEGKSILIDGQVSLNNTVWTDEFDRLDPAPWIEYDRMNQGTVSIESEALKLVAGSDDKASIKADRAVNLKEIKVSFRVKTTVVGIEGANVEILTQTGSGVDLDYYLPTSELRLKTGQRGGFYAVDRTYFNHQTNIWYDVEISVSQDGDIECTWGGTALSGSFDLASNISIVSLGIDRRGVAYFDDVVVITTHVDGTVSSNAIELPEGMEWESFMMTQTLPSETGMALTLLDSSTMAPIPGFTRLPVHTTSLSGVDPIIHSGIVIQLYMVAFGFDMPTVDAWSVSWTEGKEKWYESFDDTSAVNISGDAIVSDGALKTPNIVVKDEFTRLPIDPWRVSSGVSEIRKGHLWTGNPQTSLSKVHLDTDQFTRSLVNLKVMPRSLTQSGPRVELTTAGSEVYFFEYIHLSHSMRILVDDGAPIVIASGPITLSTGSWYDFQIDYSGSTLVFSIGSVNVQALVTLASPFNGISLSSLMDEQTYWDDLLITVPVKRGTAITSPISTPYNKGWMNLTIMGDFPSGCIMNVTVLDGDSYEPLPGFVNISDTSIDLSPIDPRDHNTIRLEFMLEGIHFRVPAIDWISIDFDWVVDVVFQTRPFEKITLLEDIPQHRIFNLTDYYGSKYTPSEELTYQITGMSNPDKVLPYLEGLELSINLPTLHWYGEAFFRINCSNEERWVVSKDIEVVVLPVDDPPEIGSLEVFEAIEDEDSMLDMSIYVSDVDTPIQNLSILPRDKNVTSDGLVLTFRFTKGGFTIIIPLEIADTHSRVFANLTVTVIETNDPPIVYGVSRKLFVEDKADTVDLFVYVEDEDTPKEDIKLVCDHHAVIDITGFNITFLYTKWEPEHTVTFRAFDGISYTNGSFLVRVEERNDPPVILGLGEYDPPVTVVMDEDTVIWLEIRVEDEDNDAFLYTVESPWNGITVFSNGTLRITSIKGEIGSFEFTLTVDDRVGGIAVVEAMVQVMNVNDPPHSLLLLQPNNHTQVEEGTNITFKVEVSDIDIPLGDVVTVTWTSNISGEIRTLTSEGDLSFITDELAVGDHRITVTATDGEAMTEIWFKVTVLERYVPPPPEEPEDTSFFTEPTGIAVIVLVVVLVLVMVALLVSRTRGGEEVPVVQEPPSEALGAEVQEEPTGDLASLSEELDRMASDLERQRDIERTSWEETPQLETVPIPAMPTETQEISEAEKAERLHATQVREVGKALTQLPRGLPTTLWGKDLSQLARDIVDGPKKDAPDGTPLVQVDGHWYKADHTNVGTFLQEYKEEAAGPSKGASERARKLEQLEERLLEGKISEETYQELKKKYE